MIGPVRRALMTSIGLALVRRKLQRQKGPGAAVALVGLELFGPRILQLRRLLVWALALTIVGGIVVAAVWWWRRPGSTATEAPTATPPAGPQPVTDTAEESPTDWAPEAA
jgi:hypothetical protein